MILFIHLIPRFATFHRQYLLTSLEDLFVTTSTGFYMAKLDEIGYQVCLNRCVDVYEQCLEIVLFHAFTALFSSPYPTSFLKILQDFEH